jgi:hypothetical protein
MRTTRLEANAASLEDWIERRTGLVLAAFAAAYLAAFLVIDAVRPMWTDEFYSFYIARLPLPEMWNAMLTGADQHPPLFYLVTRLSLAIFGENELAVRLPATLGFLAMTLAVFAFARRRIPALFALIALLFPFLTGAVDYAEEGRGYGLVLGATGVALLCWQATSDQRRRRWALPGLALAMAAAPGFHYYAVFFVIPLAAGELVRTFQRRRLDWPVWLAFSATGASLLASLPALMAARSYGSTFWGSPTFEAASSYFRVVMAHSAIPLLLAFALAAIYITARRDEPEPPARTAREGLPLDELVALLATLAMPSLVVAVTIVAEAGYHFRYVLFPVFALGILLAVITAGLPRRAVVGALVLASMVSWLGVRAVFRIAERVAGEPTVEAESDFLRNRAPQDLPIVLSESLVLFRMNHYGASDLRERIVFLAEPAASLRFVKHDTIDRGLLDLEPYFPLPVERYCEYLQPGRRFLFYGHFSDGKWNWLSAALASDGFEVKMLGSLEGRVLLLVEAPAVLPSCAEGFVAPTRDMRASMRRAGPEGS